MAFSKEEFFIDVAGIWQHEQRLYQVRKSSPAHYHGLHHYLSHFYLLNQHPPFISREKVQQDPGLAGYYDRYCKRYKEQKGWLLDYFAHGGAFYDMNRSCVIEKSEVTPAHFPKEKSPFVPFLLVDEHDVVQVREFSFSYGMVMPADFFTVSLQQVLFHSKATTQQKKDWNLKTLYKNSWPWKLSLSRGANDATV